MRTVLYRIMVGFTITLVYAVPDYAQASQTHQDNSNLMLYALLIACALVFIVAFVLIADNYIRMEGRRQKVDTDGLNLWGGFFSLSKHRGK